MPLGAVHPIWFTDEAVEGWRAAPRTTPGGQPWYSPLAILTALTLHAVFRLAFRQTEGLIGSIIGLLGLALAVPDHSTLSRRATTLEAERTPPRLPEHRLLLDFLPFETRPLRRGGVRLYRVDYSSRDLAPLWRRDNGRGGVPRVVAYDPRSLARVWVVDETTGEYLPPIPYRVPHPDMTLAESEEARRRMRALKAEDRTERRLFENLAQLRAILAGARTATARRKAERSRQARRGAREDAARLAGGKGLAAPVDDGGADGGPPVAAPISGRGGDDARSTEPPWAGQAIAPIAEVERL